MIPFIDLKAQYKGIKADVEAAVLKVLDSGQFSLGFGVQGFEEAFAEYCNTRYVAGVNSGTSALHLALLAAGVGPGDEVITVSMTFVATVAAIDYAGAKPVFVDIDPITRNIDISRIEGAITERTKAIVPVHLHGLMADMDPIIEIAKTHGLTVIEDAAQAHGAEYKGRRAGSIGHIGCFSFYPAKNLGACGEGGAVVSNNEEYIHRVKMLRDWGQDGKYNHVLKGFNYRMDGIQGAVLNVKLKHIEDWTEARRHNAAYYDALLDNSGIVKTPVSASHYRHVYHIYAIDVPNRDQTQAQLGAQTIYTGIHYPVPVHLQKAYLDFGYKRGDFPHTEKMADHTLSLPMFPELNAEQQEQVVTALERALSSG